MRILWLPFYFFSKISLRKTRTGCCTYLLTGRHLLACLHGLNMGHLLLWVHLHHIITHGYTSRHLVSHLLHHCLLLPLRLDDLQPLLLNLLCSDF